MAEESQTGPVPSGDKPNEAVLRSGEVSYKGKEHKLHLTSKGLRLAESSDKSNTGAPVADVSVIDVEWIDVLCANETPEKTSPQDVSDSVFVIHYIHKKADHKLCCKSVMLETKQESAQSWTSHIMEKCKEGKPQQLLIIINPIGGKGTAPQTFKKKVQHIFDLARVKLIVKETERAKHAVEIVKTFDVSTVDGVIAMGGDGMYMEILHGLTLRKQEEEGIDYNDPAAKLIPPTVRIGIIPAGTGNGVAGWLNGVIDIETAVLNIIRGEIGRANMFAIFESGKLIHYAGLLLGNGNFSALIQRTDELRWMRRARYPYAVLESIFSKKRVVECNIEVLRQEADSKDKTDDSGDGAGAAASGWTKVDAKQATAIMAFLATIVEGEGEKMAYDPFHPSFDLFIMGTSSNLENFKFFFKLMTLKKSAFEMDCVKIIRDIVGVRFELVQHPQNEASTKQQEEIVELHKLLDIDGELFKISSPKFEARFHPQFLHVYCAPSLYNSKTKAET